MVAVVAALALAASGSSAAKLELRGRRLQSFGGGHLRCAVCKAHRHGSPLGAPNSAKGPPRVPRRSPCIIRAADRRHDPAPEEGRRNGSFAAAWQLLGQDRLAEAEMYFRRVLAQDPDALESIVNLGAVADLFARAELDEALARFLDDSLAIDLKRKLAERTR